MRLSWLAFAAFALLSRPAPIVFAQQVEPPAGIGAGDWSMIRAAHEAHRHAVVACEGAYRARNPGQRWSSCFDGRGFLVEPDGGGWTWGLELASFGRAGAERPVASPAAVIAEGPRVAYEWDGALVEWYVNDARGLEHGYTLHSRPADGPGPLRFSLAIRASLSAMVCDGGRDVRFVDACGGAAVSYAGLVAFDADGRSLGARFEVFDGRLVLEVDDRDARYPLTIDPIAQQAYLKASNTDTTDEFGFSVAVSGDTIVVGAPREDSGAIGVNGDQFDESAVRSGAAYVFVRGGATWSQQAYLKASNTDAMDQFGTSVAIAGDTVVVGAHWEDSPATGVNGNQASDAAADAGAAYVFVRNGTTWSQQAYLKASNTDAGDLFGWSVAVSGDTVVVGAYGEDSNATGVDGNGSTNASSFSGAAYVFARSGTTWSQQAYLKASNTGASDLFGFAVSVSGDTAVIGAYREDSAATGVNGNQADNGATDSGAVYVFVRNGATWSQEAYLKASNTGVSDVFGRAVGVSGDTVLVGADLEDSSATGVGGNQGDNSAPDSGAAYVFVRAGSTWNQQAYLKASNTDASDVFGVAVAVSGDIAVVATDNEASAATGVNGNQADNSMGGAGAAYVFARSGTIWSQEAYLKASNTFTFDRFGTAASISGDTIVVGAYGEDSGATGVNGNQADNSASAAGAAYVFDRCTLDGDLDGVADCVDNCDAIANPGQQDCDLDGEGDACELASGTQWDSNGNGTPDQCEGCPAIIVYCTAGTTTNGCNATMSATGTPSVSATSGFVLTTTNVEGQRQGLMFYGITGPKASPWGGGSPSFLCVKSPTQRMGGQVSGGTDGACDGQYSEDWLDYITTHPGAVGTPFAAGAIVNAQTWFRDPPAPQTTNLSNAIQFTTCP